VAQVLPENEESQRAWNGVLFDRFVKYRELVIAGLVGHGTAAMRLEPPNAGDHVVDLGCGFGDSAIALAELVGPAGSVLGVNVRFEVMDVQAAEFDETFDYAFSRFGTMFFASPVAALRNVRRALMPGGRICFVVWRQKADNPWLHRAEEVVKPLVDIPEETDEARCGPGPFAMANADTVSQMLVSAGFGEIGFHRRDLPYKIGATLDEAIEFNLDLGPAAEAVRLAGAEGAAMRPRLAGLLRDALRDLETPAGVYAGSSVWIVTARAA
jgi:ubiquinone/menaquinone biosynthesis C-methylase UbiE